MSITSLNAEENNRKLFRLYQKSLSQNNVEQYTSYAEKLANWLSDGKAYYNGARQEIVNLLLTAQKTFREAVGNTQGPTTTFNISNYAEHQMAASYVRLIQAVIPFEGLFTEPILRYHIRNLRQSITMPVSISVAQVPPGYIPSPIIARSPGPISAIPQGINLSPPRASQSTSSPVAPKRPSGGTSNTSQVIIARRPVAVKRPAPTWEDIPATPTSSPYTKEDFDLGKPTLPRAKHKKKWSTTDLSALVERDLLAFRRKQAEAPNTSHDASSIQATVHVSEGVVLHKALSKPGVSTSSSNTLPVEDTSDEDVATSAESELFEHKECTPAQTQPIQDTQNFQQSSLTIRSSNFTDRQILLTEGRSTPEVDIPPTPSKLDNIDIRTNVSNTGDHKSSYEVDVIDETYKNSVNPSKQPVAGSGLPEAPIYPYIATLEFDDNGTGVAPSIASDSDHIDELINDEDQQVEEILMPVDGRDDTLSARSPSVPKDQHNVPKSDVTDTMEVDNHEPDKKVAGEPAEHLNSRNKMITRSPGGIPMKEVPSDDSIDEIIAISDEDTSTDTNQVSDGEDVKKDMTLAHIEHTKLIVLSHHTNVKKRKRSESPMNTKLAVRRPPPYMLSPRKTTSAQTAEPDTNIFTNDEPAEINAATSLTSPESEDVKNETLLQPPPRSTGVFGREMRIISIQRGLTEGNKVTLNFHISKQQYLALTGWKDRHQSSKDPRNTFCLSIGCYAADELGNFEKETNLGEKLSRLKSIWPIDGGLAMNIMYNGAWYILPSAPPLMVTPDNLVDLSHFLSMGENTIELVQHSDLTKHVFVLHTHHPTASQIGQVESRRRKQRNWESWLRHVSRPLDIPANMSTLTM